MSGQLVVGPHSSSSLIRSNSEFTVQGITTTNLQVANLEVSSDLNVTGDVDITGNYQINNTDVLSSDTLGAGVIQSSLETVGNLTDLTVVGDLTVDTNTLVVDSTNDVVGINNATPDGAYSLDVFGDVNIDGGVTISGDLNVLGGITSTFSTTATVEENFIKLATSNTADLIDTGVYNIYQESGTTKFAGYFRDATDSVFKFFEGSEVEPSTTIDIGATGYQLADIQVDNLIANTINVSTTAYVQDINVTSKITTTDLIVNTDTLVVDSSTDRVGINNSTPSYELDVSGDINTTGLYRINGISVLTNDTLGIGVTQSSLETVGNLLDLTVVGDLTVDTDTLYVQSASDRVGINTLTPAYTLDVSGDINTSSDYKVSGTTVLNATTLGSGIVNSSLTSVGTLNNLTVSGNTTIDGGTLFVDTINNRVGVNTLAPTNKLHVYESNAGSTIQVRVENANTSGQAGIQLNNGSTNLNIRQNVDETVIENVGGNIHYRAQDTGYHRFYTTDSNTQRMTIENNGNVGIGTTTTPGFTLDVNNEINASSGYYLDGEKVISGNGITTPGDFIFNDTTMFEGVGNNIYVHTTGDRQFDFTADADFIVRNGNIGVNVQNPSLDISLGTTNTGFQYVATNEIAIHTAGSERIRIDNIGNFGIKKSNPLYSLDVFGDMNFTGSLYQNGVPYVSPDGIWTQLGSGAYLTQFGNVAIGTTTPTEKLHVAGNIIATGTNYGTQTMAKINVYYTNTAPGIPLYLYTQHTITNLGGIPPTYRFNRDFTYNNGFDDSNTDQSPSSSPPPIEMTRLIPLTSGMYNVTINITWAASAAGRREVYFQINGSGRYAALTLPAISGASISMSTSEVVQLAANDIIQVAVFQNTGAVLSVTSGTVSVTKLSTYF